MLARPSASLMFVPIRARGGRDQRILSIQSYRPNAYSPGRSEDLASPRRLLRRGALELHPLQQEGNPRPPGGDRQVIARKRSSSKNLEGVIRSWNAGAERIFGYSGGRGARPARSPCCCRRTVWGTRRAFLTWCNAARPWSPFETLRVRKDGRLIDISAAISPIPMPRAR